VFELYGTVRELETDLPIAGAKLDVGNATTTTDAEGRFSMPGLQASFVQMITSHAAYDTVRTPISPFPGRIQIGVRMRPSAAAIVAP
jgi:hypothetical protein